MIFALEHDLERVRPLFTGEHLALVIDAVIAGNSPGSLWVDDLADPHSAFLWDKTHSFYWTGAVDRTAYNAALKRLFIGQITPYALAHDLGIFKVYSSNEAWEHPIESLFADNDLRKLDRVFYRGNTLNIPDWREQLPAGFQISAINEQFSMLSTLANFDLVTEEIESCWNKLNDFRERGFGFCAHDAETIVCWCTAEYVSGKQCGIGIETVEAYGRRGLATLTASAFVEHAFTQGISPHWDAWKTNTPSVRVAEKVGFQKMEEYSIYVGKFGV
jgi:RimJ/RimL family protein N-acetyltransferase